MTQHVWMSLKPSSAAIRRALPSEQIPPWTRIMRMRMDDFRGKNPNSVPGGMAEPCGCGDGARLGSSFARAFSFIYLEIHGRTVYIS